MKVIFYLKINIQKGEKYKNIMKLEQYIRAEINNKIIPLVKKDKCEICNSDENLEEHII